MVQRKSTRKKFGDSLPTNQSIGTHSVKIYIKNVELYERIRKQVVPTNGKAQSVGLGVFKYVGWEWEDGGIFCGYCDSLKSGLIQFIGDDAARNFESFQKSYLAKLEPQLLAGLSFGTTVSCGIRLNESWNEAEVSEKFQKIIAQQEKKQPKFSHTKDGLQIGSKSTDNYIVIVPLSTSSGIVTKVQFVAKVTKPSSILEFFIANQDSSLEDLLALGLIQFVSKLTLVGFLVDVKTSLIENHKIGKIQEKKETTVLSKDGKTVQRSLSAVRNKLISTTTEKEAKQLFLAWLNEIGILFKDDQSFKKAASTISAPAGQPTQETFITAAPDQPTEENPSSGGGTRRRQST